MKGKSKYIVPLLLAGVTASAGVVTTINQQQQTTVQAETTDSKVINDINGAELKVKGGFEDIYQLGDEVSMPEVDCDAAFDVVYRIYRGSKEVATITDPTEKFEPTYTGAYNVVIEATKDNTVVSKMTGLTIMVEKDDATINLPVNSEYVIPAQIPVSNEKGLTIPAPTVTLNDDEEPLSASEAGLVVKLITPASDDEPITLALDQSGKFYKVTKEQLATAGTYQIRYEYRDSVSNVLISKLETNFQAVNNLDIPENLYLKLNGSVPSTGNVNTEITLPKVTVLDSKSSTDGINAHVTVKVSKIADDGSIVKTWEIEDYKNYTFTPPADGEGNYVVSYEADLNSIYNGVSSTLYQPATIIKVTDKANPTVMPTYAYQVEEGKVVGIDYDNNDSYEKTGDDLEELLVNRKVDIPSVVVRKDGVAKFKLPAIYGTDNKDGNALTFAREIVGNNIAKITVTAAANKQSEEITLRNTGNYEVRYIATDAAGNKVRATYTLVVKDADDVKDGKTNLNLGIGVTSITNKETLTFSAPTATDTYDSYLDVEVGYEVLTNNPDYDPLDEDSQEFIAINGSKVELTETNDNGKYEIKIADVLEDYTEAKYLRAYTTATADSTLLGTRDAFASDTTTTVTKDIKLVDNSGDETPASIAINGVAADASTWNQALLELNAKNTIEGFVTFDNDDNPTYNGFIDKDGYAYEGTLSSKGDVYKSNGGASLAAFDQGNGSITLPEVKFSDTDENLRLTLTISDRFGNAVTKDTYEMIERVQNGSSWDYTVGGASFKLSASGVYTVTYRAQDTAGNIVVKSFGIRVNDKTAPTIVIDDEDKFGVDIEVGDFFEVPVGNLYKDGVAEDGEVTWQLTCSAGAVAETSATGFTPLTEGTYYITYTGVDELDNLQILQDNSLFFVKAVDTTDPVFNDDSSYSLNPTMAWNPDENDEMEVKIPVVFATDPIKNESLDVVYTVTSPNGKKVTIKDYDEETDVRYFMATAQGIYTVTFEATDSANNTVKMTKEIAIGDCEAPEIEWKNETDIPTNKTLGETWTLPLSNMTLTDNITTDADTLTDNMKISLVKPDGTTAVTNEGTTGKNYIWTFNETGAYTLRIVVEDEAGQSRTYKYTINVASEEVEESKINSVVGTVLIVISVVVLAGVVIYFVVSSRKKAPVKAPKSKKKD